jgi:hypothetical protein
LKYLNNTKRIEQIKLKHDKEQYLLKQIWNTLNPKLYDDINNEVLKETIFILLNPYDTNGIKETFMKELISIVSNLESNIA